MNHRRITRFAFTTVSVLAASAMLFALVVASSQIDIPGPAGSGLFGNSVTLLPNGNLVICDPGYGPADVGAAYLYNGADGSLISTLTGSTAGDRICSFGVTVLANGNYLVVSPNWDNGAAIDAGAVTLGDSETGVSGMVSAVNSLVGSTAYDHIGATFGQVCDRAGCEVILVNGVTVLANGNYLVVSPQWANGAAADAGAVTWGDGEFGLSGTVNAANSLVGSSTGDLRWTFVTELANGNYLVVSPQWANGAAADAGAVTWGDGETGLSGTVSAANSLVGSSPYDSITRSVSILPNGNYLVSSPNWDNGSAVDAGAVTWGNGTTGVAGPISAANSLVGSSANDQIGYFGLFIELSNGNCLIPSPYWDNDAMTDAGAVTWINGTTGITGPVSPANSLVGSSTGDKIGVYFSVTALANGNYVVESTDWDNGAAADAGAVTWGNGATGIAGPVSAANSLVGSSSGDRVGWVTKLANGNYVVRSSLWDNATTMDAGAVTWVNGATGITGPVSAANSLVGSSTGDLIGKYVDQLANGNYLVSSPYWDNGVVADAGAVILADGTIGITGPVSAANSLVGSSAGDQVGQQSPYASGVVQLANGKYLVRSPYWDHGVVADAGAVTLADGAIGITGPVNAANSLVGSSPDDQIGNYVDQLANGNYLVSSPNWDNGAVADAGAVTWVNGATGFTGPVSAANSLVGSSPGDQVGYGYFGVSALSNGNYVVSSRYWDNGAATDAGAVTWADGKTGVSGTVSAANSLVGSTTGDHIGFEANDQGELINNVSVLSNGNYVVSSPDWDNGAGAVTWGDGRSGTIGAITDENSVLGGVFYKYDPYNEQLVVSRLWENIVTLFRPNRVPVAEAGRPLIVTRGAFVRLDGSASYDLDENLPLQFTWTQTGGPPVVLSDPHAISPTFTAPDERTSLTFTLVVTDALGSYSKPARAIVFVDPYQYFWPIIPEH